MSRSAGVPCRSFVSFLKAYCTEIGRFMRNWPCIASMAASDDSKLSKLTKPKPLEMPALRQHAFMSWSNIKFTRLTTEATKTGKRGLSGQCIVLHKKDDNKKCSQKSRIAIAPSVSASPLLAVMLPNLGACAWRSHALRSVYISLHVAMTAMSHPEDSRYAGMMCKACHPTTQQNCV
jgi:hypothetical protein